VHEADEVVGGFGGLEEGDVGVGQEGIKGPGEIGQAASHRQVAPPAETGMVEDPGQPKNLNPQSAIVWVSRAE